jgi:hypothetical protein
MKTSNRQLQHMMYTQMKKEYIGIYEEILTSNQYN